MRMSEGKGYIQQVPASYLIALSTVVFLLFISVFGGALLFPSLIMYMLLVASLVLNRDFVRKEEGPEPTREQFGQIGLFAMFGLITFLILNIFVPELKFGTGTTTGTVTVNLITGSTPLTIGAIWSGTFTAAFIFGVFLVPVAEENFFRVLMGNVALKYLPFFVVIPIIGALPVVAFVLVGLIFATFHLAAYGLNYTNMVLLWGAGSVLYALDLQAGNPLPSILAHMSNNGISMVLQSNALLFLFPSLASLVPSTILPLLQLAPIIILIVYRIMGHNLNPRFKVIGK